MKTRFAVAAGSLALVLGLGGQALAGMAGATRTGPPTFADLDVDSNGVLSEAEAAGTKGLLDNWDQADRNGDHVIERSEFAAFEAWGTMPSAAPPLPPALPQPEPVMRPEPVIRY